MNEEYYILEGDFKRGPFTFNELMNMDIDIHTQIITGGNDKAQYASELPELNAYFEARGILFPTEDNLAGFGKRALAFIIDYFPLYIIVSNIEIKMGWIALPTNYRWGMAVPDSMVILSSSFLATFLLYNTILEATQLKGSLGKKMMRLSVVDIDGKSLSLPRAFMRNLGVILSTTLWVPFLTVFFSEHKQAWYDSLAKTYVIVTE